MKLININKSFNDLVIFKDFSYDFKEGFYFIKGASGRGKTTLLKMIASLEDYEGEIKGNEDVAILFQEDRLLEEFSVFNNLKLVKNDLKKEKAKALLKELKLDCNLDDRVSQLSGGMKRRLAILRCLLLEAKVYLFDEAFNNMDKSRCEPLMEFFKQLDVEVFMIMHSDRVNSVFDKVDTCIGISRIKDKCSAYIMSKEDLIDA